MQNIFELEEKHTILENQIKELEGKIIQLEDLFKCFKCKNVKLLVNCYSCDQRVCNQCYICVHTKQYNQENVLVYYCKKCGYSR